LNRDTVNSNSRLFSIFQKTKYLSVKFSSYFQVYEELFAKYVDKPVTFVEVGILHGGSLWMWREYFGKQARIIGVDLNPNARKWEGEGFEIFIGDQGDPNFWSDFFAKVGKIDVLLDDGGHTNVHQVVTTSGAIDHVNDGGIILIEDAHTNYLRSFNNPSRYSFINYAKAAVDAVNSRMGLLQPIDNAFRRRAYSITFYESMVAFHIDSRKALVSEIINNGGEETGAQDMRALAGASSVETFARRRMAFLKELPFARPVSKVAFSYLQTVKRLWSSQKDNRVLKKYFDNK
jgi:cephalosporin hydroxylase